MISYDMLLEADSASRLRDLECHWCLTEYPGRETARADYLAPQIMNETDADGREVVWYRFVPICEGCLGDWYADIPAPNRMPLIRIDWVL